MNLPNKLTVLRLILVPFFVAALFVPIPHHMLIALLTAVTIVVGMRIMGTMLISSLIIFPALSKSLKVSR